MSPGADKTCSLTFGAHLGPDWSLLGASRPDASKKSTNHSFIDETLGSRQVSDVDNLALLSNSTLPGGSMVNIIWRVLKLEFLPAMIAV